MMPLQRNKADASRMDEDMLVTSNFADDELRRREAGDMRRGRMSGIELIVIQRSQTKLIVIAQGIRFRA